MTAIVQSRQSTIDVALQHFGSAEMCFVVAERLGVGIADELIAGSSFDYSPSEVADKAISNSYAKNNVIPATAIDGDFRAGIDFWVIEQTFRVI
ncbi:MAG: hypothetical protein ACRC9X_05240 [Bacteroidales bacterium]